VNRGGVIFASELLGNFWKAHLELTAQGWRRPRTAAGVATSVGATTHWRRVR
jgi:hypothetical protein